MRLIAILLVMLVSGIAAQPAFATGSLACEIDDGNLKVDIEARFSYGGPGQLFQVSGTLVPKDKNTPEALKSIVLADENLTQHWLLDTDLKLELYQEITIGPFGAVLLQIIATQAPDDESSFSGRYKMRLTHVGESADSATIETVTSGAVSCSAG